MKLGAVSRHLVGGWSLRAMAKNVGGVYCECGAGTLRWRAQLAV